MSGRLTAATECSQNDGNFRTLLRTRVHAGDGVLADNFDQGAANAQYVSPEIPNELLDMHLGSW